LLNIFGCKINKKIQLLISRKGKIKDDYFGGVNDKTVERNETFSIIYRAGFWWLITKKIRRMIREQ